MSRVTTANYKTEAAKTSKSPVWIAKISGVATFFSTGTFGDIDGNYKKIMRNVQYSGPKINLDLNTFEWGSLTFEIVDVDNVFTNLLADPIAINNIKVELFHGYQVLDFADFSQFPDMFIFKVGFFDDYLVYEVNARSNGHQLFQQSILRGQLVNDLDAAVVRAANTMSCTKTDDFLGVTDVPGAHTYVALGNKEIARYDTKDDPNDDLEDMTRGEEGDDTAHSDGQQVRQCHVFAENIGTENNTSFFENPLWFLLGILTSTDAGTNGNFDTSITGYGMEIDESLINWENIYRLGLEHFKGMDSFDTNRFWFRTIEREDAQKFLEDFFLKPLSMIFFINDDGKLDIKAVDPLSYVSESKTLNNSGIIQISSIELRYDLIVNQLKLYRGYPLEGSFREHDSYKNSTGITAYGAGPIKAIEDYFIWHTDTANAFVKKEMFRKYFGVWANPPVTAVFHVLDSKNSFSPGDWIDVTSTLLPDWINDGRGISAIPFLLLEQWFDGDECFYKMVSFEAFNGVDAYTINKRTGTDIDDQLMTLEADHAENNFTANDSRDINPTSHSAELLRIRYDITPPGGAAGWKYIDLEMKFQTATGTDRFTRDLRIHYDPSWTDEFTVWIYVYWAEGALTFSDVRTDYYATDAAGGDLIAADNVKMTEVWYITENFTVDAL